MPFFDKDHDDHVNGRDVGFFDFQADQVDWFLMEGPSCVWLKFLPSNEFFFSFGNVYGVEVNVCDVTHQDCELLFEFLAFSCSNVELPVDRRYTFGA